MAEDCNHIEIIVQQNNVIEATPRRKTPKKVWWLKEELDIFESKLVRKIRMQENGDSLFVVFHRLQLLFAKNYGFIKIENFGETPAEDIAFSIQENPDYVQKVMEILEEHGLITYSEDGKEAFYPEVMERICTQSDSTERTRRWRERQKLKALQEETED